jgi:hypothetical protein
VDVLVNGESVGPEASVDLTGITEDNEISAVFQQVAALTIHSSRTTSRRGHSVRFYGSIAPSVPNGTHLVAEIRKRGSATWTTLATINTYKGHHWGYRLHTVGRKHGTYYVRVRYDGSPTLLASVSADKKVTIK